VRKQEQDATILAIQQLHGQQISLLKQEMTTLKKGHALEITNLKLKHAEQIRGMESEHLAEVERIKIQPLCIAVPYHEKPKTADAATQQP
jgi:hypothetical protein